MEFYDIIGTFGTGCIVTAYLLLQTGRTKSDSTGYLSSNLFGAICLLISLCYNFNLASFIIECFWILASLIGIYNKFYGTTKV